jgi:hypothetical protein
MMNLLTNLHDQLENEGAVVHSYAMCGATAADWLSRSTASCGTGERHDKGPPIFDMKNHVGWVLGDLIQQNHPNMIVVQLADTMAGYGAQLEHSWVDEMLHAFTGKIRASGLPCVWVGPIWGQESAPYHKTVARVTEMSQLLAHTVSPPCSYIDSTAFARPGEWPTRDGTHLQPDGYRKWGKAMADAIVRLKGQGALAAR